MLEDFRLRVFVAVARQKSFSKAAQQLRISQPAVSNHVSELEKSLKVKLFHRQHGETVLTPAGEVLMKHAVRILTDYMHLETDFAVLPACEVRVSASEDVYDFMISELLADFASVHPDISFVKSFPDNADIHVFPVPDEKNRGTFTLGFRPSVQFASTTLWKVLFQTLEPSLK